MVERSTFLVFFVILKKEKKKFTDIDRFPGKLNAAQFSNVCFA